MLCRPVQRIQDVDASGRKLKGYSTKVEMMTLMYDQARPSWFMNGSPSVPAWSILTSHIDDVHSKLRTHFLANFMLAS